MKTTKIKHLQTGGVRETVGERKGFRATDIRGKGVKKRMNSVPEQSLQCQFPHCQAGRQGEYEWAQSRWRRAWEVNGGREKGKEDEQNRNNVGIGERRTPPGTEAMEQSQQRRVGVSHHRSQGPATQMVGWEG